MTERGKNTHTEREELQIKRGGKERQGREDTKRLGERELETKEGREEERQRAREGWSWRQRKREGEREE